LLRRFQREQQKVGGRSIETSQIAGHVLLRRQEELTRRIQGKRMKAGKRTKGQRVDIKTKGTAA
jgi:hypothetical protein